MISLNGRVALITGGSRGIGAACALLLARSGADVAFTYHKNDKSAQELSERLAALGRQVLAHKSDISTPEGNARFVSAAVERFGYADIFVANAGVWPDEPVPVENLTDERWTRTIATNLNGVFWGARAVIPHLRPQGRLIFISSTAGQRGEAGHADYAASKGAIISFVKSLAVELGPRDITVNAVAPGWVHTDAVERPFAGSGRGKIEAGIPLGRVASPEDIAGPVLFLASNLARHVTGEILNVNGGSVLCG